MQDLHHSSLGRVVVMMVYLGLVFFVCCSIHPPRNLLSKGWHIPVLNYSIFIMYAEIPFVSVRAVAFNCDRLYYCCQ